MNIDILGLLHLTRDGMPKLIIIGVSVVVLIIFLEYFHQKEMLQGLFTGLGVIIAKEIWDSFAEYKEHFKKKIIG